MDTRASSCTASVCVLFTFLPRSGLFLIMKLIVVLCVIVVITMGDDLQAALGRRRTSLQNAATLFEGFPDADLPSRRQLYTSNATIFEEVKMDIVMPGIEGDDVTIEVADVQLLVDRLCRSSDVLPLLFRDLLQREPCSRQEPAKVRVFFMLCSVLPACAGRCGAPISHQRVCAPLAILNLVFDYVVFVCVLTFMSQNVWPTGPNIVIGLVKCAPLARRGLSLAFHGVPACLRP